MRPTIGFNLHFRVACLQGAPGAKRFSLNVCIKYHLWTVSLRATIAIELSL